LFVPEFARVDAHVGIAHVRAKAEQEDEETPVECLREHPKE
jgi:hypothetical protein